AVAPPRLDLGNEDLVRAHVHAIWLSETGTDLGKSLGDVLNLEAPNLPVNDRIATETSKPNVLLRSRERAARMLARIGDDLELAPWHHAGWLDETLRQVGNRFDRTADRWRGLYTAAVDQMNRQHAVILDASAPPVKRRQAERLHREARMQRDLLIDAESAMA